MSQYAVQAIIMAATDDDSVKAKLKDPAQFDEVIDHILSLSPQEKEDLKHALTNESDSPVVAKETDERNNPGPGIMGV